MLEAPWQEIVEGIADRYGWSHWHTARSGGPGARGPRGRNSDPGWPDLALVKAPRLVIVELKSSDPKSKPTRDQVRTLRALEACGVEVGLWRPADQAQVIRCLGPRAERVTLPPDFPG